MIITRYTTRTYDCCYKLTVDKEYLISLNEYFHDRVIDADAQNINFTADDVKAIMGNDTHSVPQEWLTKQYTFTNNREDPEHYSWHETIWDWVYDVVNDDIYDNWYDEECVDEESCETYFE